MKQGPLSLKGLFECEGEIRRVGERIQIKKTGTLIE